MKDHGEELMHVDLIIVEDTQNEHEHILHKSHRKNEEHAEVKRQEDAEMEDHMEGEHVEREKQENQKEGAETEDVDSADEDVGDDHSDTFVDDLSNEQTSISDNEDDANNEVPLADAEIEELVDEFLEVESKAAEAQESLEKEALAQVNNEVRAELAESLHGDALEMAVSSEMKTFVENWEAVLDDLETQSSLLLEQLDGAGIDLSNLYKWIESQAPNGCCTEAWKKRAHWVGCQVSSELSESVRNAEAYLQSCRPVRRQHGKLLEEGASGYLARKLSVEDRNSLTENSEKDWSSFNQLIQPRNCTESGSFGSENWASVYLASTPHQAASLGLKLPGVDEVEEIGEIEYDSGDPFYADAIANEKEIDLSEEQKRNFRKVREEDDAKITRKLQCYLKKKRRGKRKCPEPIEKEASSGRVLPNECSHPAFEGSNFEIGEVNCDIRENSAQELKSHVVNNECKIEDSAADTLKRSHDNNDIKVDNKRCRTVIIDSDDEVQVLENNSVSNKQSRYQGSPSQIEKVIDIIDVDILPSPFSKSFCSEDNNSEIYCTACSRVLEISEVNKHPHLEVIVCESCENLLQEKNRFEDPCLGTYCVWCGNSIDLIQCNFCKMRFCEICLTRNFGKERSLEAKTSGWRCCCCLPILLHQLILECEKVVGGRQASGSETDSEVSEAEKDAPISNKRRKKKRIRRILDDAELGEETKKIIAIEKARQEHLKTMQVQASRKSWSKYITKLNGISEGDANVAILGDAKEGYIVNVAKEEDEEPVRIPPSISAKLKPHQVAGIRFMWENVIQSVKKVQSGDKGLGCILAHTMGLGKTFQVIAFLYTALRGVNLGLRTALVVTPVNVLHNWRYEFDKWRPLEYKPLRVLMLEDVVRERRAHLLAKWRTKGGVLLIGYAAFRNLSLGRHQKDRESANEICRALQYGPDILVCDEAHMIKNTKAETTHALKQVQTQRRIALTGSPLQNNLMEYYCMVDFVREGFLGSSHEFRNRFQNPIEHGQHTNSTSQDVKIMNQRSHILYEQLKGFVQRMDMNVVKKDLPPKTVFVITVKLSPLQKKLYKRFLDVHGFTSDKASCEKTNKQSSFFACYQVLAQIWNHPGLLQMTKEHKDHLKREDAVENFLVDDSASDDNLEYNELLNREKQRTRSDLLPKKSDDISSREEIDWWEDLFSEKLYKQVDYSGKMVLVLDILAMSSEAGDKALVFSQSLTTLNLIEKFLSKLPRKGKEGKYWKQGKDWYRLDGRTDGLERQKLVEKFNEKLNTRVKCTLISTRAGSLGINLHAANRVIIFDGSWNPTYDLQAIYRAWRYGQSKPVYAYRLMAHGTMEEKIYKRQVTKEGLAARVVDRQQIHRTMSKEDIRYLFDFGDEENTDTAEQGQDQLVLYNQNTTADIARLTEQKSLHHGSISSDKIMKSLLSRHSCWIANYHEHETLLQENEEERLSKEEQDMAWQTYQRSLEWQEVRKVAIDDHEMKPVQNIVAPEKVTSENIISQQTTSSSRSHPVHPRKCSNLAHLLTLRSQNIKAGCITNCSECLQEISWESLNRDGKSK